MLGKGQKSRGEEEFSISADIEFFITVSWVGRNQEAFNEVNWAS